MRDDYASFQAAGARIVVVTSHDLAKMKAYWKKHALPYIDLPDPEGLLAKRYGQEWKLLKLGQIPAQFIVDCQGKIAFAHYGSGMSDIPLNQEMLRLIKALPPCSAAP